MRKLALATVTAMFITGSAYAVPVIQFSQTSNLNTIGATDNGTTTNITGTDIQVNISQDAGGFLGIAYLDLFASSIDAAVSLGTAVLQHFAGNFSVTSTPSGGINILSGTFTDAAIGAGPGLGLVIGSPPDALSLSSDIIPSSALQPPLALSFSLTNVSPLIGIDGKTLAAFNSTVAGNASASVNTLEPGSLAILGTALVGLGLIMRRRQEGV